MSKYFSVLYRHSSRNTIATATICCSFQMLFGCTLCMHLRGWSTFWLRMIDGLRFFDQRTITQWKALSTFEFDTAAHLTSSTTGFLFLILYKLRKFFSTQARVLDNSSKGGDHAIYAGSVNTFMSRRHAHNISTGIPSVLVLFLDLDWTQGLAQPLHVQTVCIHSCDAQEVRRSSHKKLSQHCSDAS